ncbi:unnamed protein product [Symbiodinium sp. KB8]|nr:unnamed protein product [Symbiodinium sp. KB8]
MALQPKARTLEKPTSQGERVVRAAHLRFAQSWMICFLRCSPVEALLLVLAPDLLLLLEIIGLSCRAMWSSVRVLFLSMTSLNSLGFSSTAAMNTQSFRWCESALLHAMAQSSQDRIRVPRHNIPAEQL